MLRLLTAHKPSDERRDVGSTRNHNGHPVITTTSSTDKPPIHKMPKTSKTFFGFIRTAFVNSGHHLKSSVKTKASSSAVVAQAEVNPSEPTLLSIDSSDQSSKNSINESPIRKQRKVLEFPGIVVEKTITTPPRKQEDEVVSDDNKRASSSFKKKESKENEIITIDALALVLSSPSYSHNEIGLNKLYEIVKRSKTKSKNLQKPDDKVRAIVMGGNGGSFWRSTTGPEERLRSALLYFLCGEDWHNTNDDTSTLFSDASTCVYIEDENDDGCYGMEAFQQQQQQNNTLSDEDSNSRDAGIVGYVPGNIVNANPTTVVVEEEHYTNNNNTKEKWLELHVLALKTVARSLDSWIWRIRQHNEVGELTAGTSKKIYHVNFHDDTFWGDVLDALLYNIEEYQRKVVDERITGYSLKIFRLLYSIDPSAMEQMLHQTLLPYILHLSQQLSSSSSTEDVKSEESQEAGKPQFSLIAYECSHLLRKANVDPPTRRKRNDDIDWMTTSSSNDMTIWNRSDVVWNHRKSLVDYLLLFSFPA